MCLLESMFNYDLFINGWKFYRILSKILYFNFIRYLSFLPISKRFGGFFPKLIAARLYLIIKKIYIYYNNNV